MPHRHSAMEQEMSSGPAPRRAIKQAATLNALFDERRGSIERRFQAFYREAENGCWIWTGGFDRGRYGQFYISQFKIAAHRVTYALKHGPIAEGFIVCHRCDDPTCVNPEHLFLGTDLDNNADRSAKRRTHQPFGAVESYRKLSAEQAKIILTDKRSARALAQEFGVSPNTVAKVRRGETWKHVSVSVADRPCA
ncbi:HNH endonuclease [Methylorubrum populi]|uniref:HNH endonuclease signature motif containing protein n=1 Tax=Methylorubrum populi TaxID=223967 RepID=UPI001150DF48|nr:HNH endonuclease signature motif containing protein [Methylorubrum populi]QDI81663.1 HNH endonuclease [Methylorubrum populi]